MVEMLVVLGVLVVLVVPVVLGVLVLLYGSYLDQLVVTT